MTRIVDVEGTISAETEKAVLFESSDTGGKEWLPLSQIEIDRDESKDIVVITLPEWLATEKGFI